MGNGEQQKKLSARAGPGQRPWYKAGNYLATDDLLTEQSYRLQRLRRHNRYMHGWGIVCGLRVVPARDAARPWGVIVCPGYAITCCGDEVEVLNPTPLDIREHVWARPQVGGKPVPVAYIGIRYAEEQGSPVLARNLSCDCDEIGYYSRIRDGFQISVLWENPAITNEVFDLCGGNPAPCPECGENQYIVLARITLPNSEGNLITLEHIDIST